MPMERDLSKASSVLSLAVTLTLAGRARRSDALILLSFGLRFVVVFLAPWLHPMEHELQDALERLLAPAPIRLRLSDPPADMYPEKAK